MSTAPLTAAASTAEPGIITRLTDWAVGLMETLGAPGAGLAVAFENLFPPVPSEVILPLAGFTASQGDLGLLSVVLWTTAGSVVGALALYLVGAAVGRERLYRLVERMPLVRVEDLGAAEAWFARHGARAVLLGRLIPIVRSLISVPAGVERMHLGRFLTLTAIGSAIWNTALVLVGYVLGEQWHAVEGVIGRYQSVVIVLAVVALAWYVVHAVITRRAVEAPRHARSR
ncbi:DedA family protein [Isoptericola sp. 4D.3]|uniref:DedA family protein n=1 Tax=Isoptericola peretonis TaxID=2918523 RepID=A0ABT0J619_9MICO|nr:DedA family protein [Isoptericola sp. 4D.3]